jgi:hypothetical protein
MARALALSPPPPQTTTSSHGIRTHDLLLPVVCVEPAVLALFVYCFPALAESAITFFVNSKSFASRVAWRTLRRVVVVAISLNGTTNSDKKGWTT